VCVSSSTGSRSPKGGRVDACTAPGARRTVHCTGRANCDCTCHVHCACALRTNTTASS
jgi:hypothetical protein